MVPQRFQIRATLSTSEFDKEALIKMLHRWIRESAVPGLLIDVVDYDHVPDGPGILLVGHEVDYGFVENELVITWKTRRMPNQQKSGSFEAVFGTAWDATNAAITAVNQAQELGDTQLAATGFAVVVLDRLVVPNGGDVPADLLATIAAVTQRDVHVNAQDDVRLPATVGVGAAE